MNFGLGWSAARSAVTMAELLTSGRYATVRAGAATPAAFSLSSCRLRHLEQGRPGTCWEHSPTQLAETFAGFRQLDPFPVCRRLIGWQGKKLEGGGNQFDGGSPTDALRAMTDGQGGVGFAHEALWPYTEDYRSLAQSPPATVLADARLRHLVAPVTVTSDDDARTLISSGHGVCNGIWWPFDWDTEGATFFTGWRGGTFGHSLLEIGYVKAGVWDQYDWWQLDNWHGLLYRPLDAAHAAKVPGYQPIQADRTSDFWVRGDAYGRLIHGTSAERVSATDLVGLASVCDLATVLSDLLGQWKMT